MPQNEIMGWRVGWPRWMDWAKAHKHTAVNKEMMEQAISAAIAGSIPGGGGEIAALAERRYVNVHGDTMDGPLVLTAFMPTDARHATPKEYVDTHAWDAGVY